MPQTQDLDATSVRPTISEMQSSQAALSHASSASSLALPIIRRMGRVDYATAYDAMRRFTAERTPATPDELWIVEHPPVYTVGVAGRPEHFPRNSHIPLVHIDRGGQITYHGPGQVVIYALIDMARRNLKVRALVHLLEQAVIDTLARHGATAERRAGAPGVYVAGAKVAALGLRIRAGRCYHGIAVNVAMDLSPYSEIDPCGYRGLRVTQTSALGIKADPGQMGEMIAQAVCELLEQSHG